MSYYYSYYVGYRDINSDKIYPLGPYSSKGKLCSALCRSSSFASDLYEDFLYIKDSQISDELRNEFEYESYNGTKEIKVKYLPVKDLPTDSYISTGYFLISDVEAYENDRYSFEGFYDKLTPQVYATKLENQLKFGPNKPKTDDFGSTYTEHDASDYMFYAYPNYESREYEAFVLRNFTGCLEDYDLKDAEYVILETEG